MQNKIFSSIQLAMISYLIWKISCQEHLATFFNSGKFFIFSYIVKVEERTRGIPYELTVSTRVVDEAIVRIYSCNERKVKTELLKQFTIVYGEPKTFKTIHSNEDISNSIVYKIESSDYVSLVASVLTPFEQTIFIDVLPFSRSSRYIYVIAASNVWWSLTITSYQDNTHIKLIIPSKFCVEGSKNIPVVNSVRSTKKTFLVERKSASMESISMSSYETLNIEFSSCDSMGLRLSSSKPVNIITGAKLTEESNSSLLTNSADSRYAMGTHFVTAFDENREDVVLVKVSTIESGNTFEITFNYNTSVVRLTDANDFVTYKRNIGGFLLIEADKKLVVGIMSAVGTSPPCFMTVLDQEFWSSAYSWTNIKKAQILFYVSIVTRRVHQKEIFLNKNQYFNWTVIRHIDKSKHIDEWSYVILLENSQVSECYHKKGEFFSLRVIGFSPVSSHCFNPNRMVNLNCTGAQGMMWKCDVAKNFLGKDAERVDGNWGSWSLPSKCESNCGTTEGKKGIIRRYCHQPSPSGGGAPCLGNKTITTYQKTCTTKLEACASSCGPYQYGFNCSLTCQNCAKPCHSKTGVCSACKSGFFSKWCNSSCPKNCHSCEYKSDSNITCLKCKEGFQRPNCSICSPTQWGPNCTKNCAATCTKSKCDKEIGVCFGCISFRWGQQCEKSCSRKCLTCKQLSGKCTECETGFWGPRCSFHCQGCRVCKFSTGACLHNQIKSSKRKALRNKLLRTHITISFLMLIFLFVLVVSLNIFKIQKRNSLFFF